jgi:hypothetical protein
LVSYQAEFDCCGCSGIQHIMEKDHVVPEDGTNARSLYDKKNTFLYTSSPQNYFGNNAIVDAIKRQCDMESNVSPDERLWIFKEVKIHHKVGNIWKVPVRWDDDTESWIMLSSLLKDNPVTLAKNAEENNLLQIPGWKRLCYYLMSKKKQNSLRKHLSINSMQHGPRIKFGIHIPSLYEQAIEFDKMNGNNLWKDASKIEMDQLYEYGTVKSLGKSVAVPKGIQKSEYTLFMMSNKMDVVKLDLLLVVILLDPTQTPTIPVLFLFELCGFLFFLLS